MAECEDHRPFCATWPDGEITIVCPNCEWVVRLNGPPSEPLAVPPATLRRMNYSALICILLGVIAVILLVGFGLVSCEGELSGFGFPDGP